MNNEYSDEVNEQMNKHITGLLNNLSHKRRERFLSYMDSYFQNISTDFRLLEEGCDNGFISDKTFSESHDKLKSEENFMKELYYRFNSKNFDSVKRLDKSFKTKG